MRDERPWLVGVVGVAVLAVCLNQPVSLSALALFTLGWAWTASPSSGPRLALLAATVVWGTVLSQGLFYEGQPREAVLAWGPVRVWRQGIVHGLTQSLRLLATLFGAWGLAHRVSTDRLLVTLPRLGVPATFALLITIAVRFLPETLAEARAIRHSLRGRGLADQGRLRAELLVLRPLVARSLRRAALVGRALEARGYEPGAPRTQGADVQGTPARWAGAGLVAGAATFAVVGRATLWMVGQQLTTNRMLTELAVGLRDWL